VEMSKITTPAISGKRGMRGSVCALGALNELERRELLNMWLC
jgi:hypothetical protein